MNSMRMKAPVPAAQLPPAGKFIVWCASGFCGGAWHVVDSQSEIRATRELGDALGMARLLEQLEGHSLTTVP